MEDSLVSIIIPTFNRAAIIGETLDSVISQSYSNWECIVVDEGSHDATEDVIEKYSNEHPNIVYLKRHRPQKGVSVCRNIGIEKAKGAFIIFLDSDDLLDKNCLKNRVAYAMHDPHNDFWVFKMQEFIGSIDNMKRIHNTYPENDSKKAYLEMFLKGTNPFSVTAPLWKRTSLIKLGGFNETLQLWEDPELHVRALLNDFSFKVNKSEQADCYYRNDRDAKLKMANKKQHLIKLYANTYNYYKSLLMLLDEMGSKENSLRKKLVLNMIHFIQHHIIERRNLKQFIKFGGLLRKYRLISYRSSIILISWFLFYFFKLKRFRSWSQDSLRKRTYYLIDRELT